MIIYYSGQSATDAFQMKAEALWLKVYRHYHITGYLTNIPLIVSYRGYGSNEYTETTKPLWWSSH